jgi:hypothetical protein
VNIARLVNIDWPGGGWDPTSDSYSAGDWDPPSDALNFAQLNSRSEPEGGHRDLRAPDRGAVRCLAAVAECFPEAPDAKSEQTSVAEAACYQNPDAERELEPHAERAPVAVEVGC